MAGGDAALLHRGRGEAREADDVAGGVDVRHGGLEGRRVDLEPAAVVGLEAAGVEVRAVGRADRGRRRRAAFRCGSAAVARAWRPAQPCAVELDALRPWRRGASCMPRLRRSCTNSSMISRSMNSRKCSRGSMIVTGTSSAQKIVAYSMPMTPAPTTARLRGTRGRARAMSSLSKTRCAVERDVARPVRPGADRDDECVGRVDQRLAVAGRDPMRCGSRKRALPATVLRRCARTGARARRSRGRASCRRRRRGPWPSMSFFTR